MGINKQVVKLLLHENKHQPITGDFLCIGKQTVNVNEDELKNIFSAQSGYDKLLGLYKNNIFDTSTRHSNKTIYDHDLISCISENVTYNCLDRSDYEGANIIQDMNEDINTDYLNKFDFIYDGGTLDNVFDPVKFIVNTNKMLKPGGRVVHMNVAGSTMGAYLMLSAEWFYSYYAINNYKDCKAYIAIAKENGKTRHEFDTDLFEWKPFFTRKDGYNYDMIEASKSIDGLMFCMVVAEKGPESTVDKMPIQIQYLDENAVDWREKWHEYSKTERAILNPDTKKSVSLPYNSDHHRYLGSEF